MQWEYFGAEIQSQQLKEDINHRREIAYLIFEVIQNFYKGKKNINDYATE